LPTIGDGALDAPRAVSSESETTPAVSTEGDSPVAASTKTHLRWLHTHLSSVRLTDIGRERIDAIARSKRKEQITVRTRNGVTPIGRTVSEGTVWCVIGVVVAVLNAAVERGWLDRAPIRKSSKAVSKRIRWLSQAEAGRLLAELPSHLADVAQFSLETSARHCRC
jgi:hypothetical protein